MLILFSYQFYTPLLFAFVTIRFCRDNFVFPVFVIAALSLNTYFRSLRIFLFGSQYDVSSNVYTFICFPWFLPALEGVVRRLIVFRELSMISSWTFFLLISDEIMGTQHHQPSGSYWSGVYMQWTAYS